ncbi:hypothetical protein GOP47_0001921 [Adiantum capillus-veneris]|uniref:Uncharacterized protein n=1 Tax=Adiantum capillus-veneris TaxID=13818 RepID=A0A9D4ZNJ5_ADICA|nr:hypothetical protein GOP47_0001921 [Adiantum capillus-veneris]
MFQNRGCAVVITEDVQLEVWLQILDGISCYPVFAEQPISANISVFHYGYFSFSDSGGCSCSEGFLSIVFIIRLGDFSVQSQQDSNVKNVMKNLTRRYCSKWVGRGRSDLKQSAEYGVDEINVDIKRFQNE